MRVIIEPKKEKEILDTTQPDVEPKKLREAVRTNNDCCVNHLCGCNCKC